MNAITAVTRRFVRFLPPGALSWSSLPPAIQADEGTFVFDNRMAGYGAERTPERPTKDACERQLVAVRSDVELTEWDAIDRFASGRNRSVSAVHVDSRSTAA